MKLSSSFVRKSLAGHSWLGVAAGAFMYLVCLSGALAVFFEELERWEQPYAPEFTAYDTQGLERAFNDYLASGAEVTPHMYLTLPTGAVPRARIATENESWFLNADGSEAGPERNAFTELLLDLHLYLHLPHSWGMLVVSGLGALLVGLIVSGIFAHPRMFRDAFNLRLKGSPMLEQVDIHNRLSVWGLPFHLMIAITGAWFGLALPFLALASQTWFDGDREAAVETVFGTEPELTGQEGPLHIVTALDTVAEMAPRAEPLFVVVHDAGEPNQFMSVAASHPGRLIYAENYLFDARGNFLRTDGFYDGAAGKQVLYSIYRLHFGHFAGLPVKILYGILGLALTVVSASGVNIWLRRRRKRDYLSHLWVGIVWGAPPALAVAAITQIMLGVPSTGILWLVMLAAMIGAVAKADEGTTRRWLQGGFAVSLVVLVAWHAARFGAPAWQRAALAINVTLLLTAAGFGAWLWRVPGGARAAGGTADPA